MKSYTTYFCDDEMFLSQKQIEDITNQIAKGVSSDFYAQLCKGENNFVQ